MKNNKVKVIAFCGVFTAVAIIFSYIESLIPIPIPIYGIKLGVANVAIIAVLYLAGWREAFVVNIVRITLTAMLFGNLNSFIFSMFGGVSSLITMIILKRINALSIVGVSIAGGVTHNIGQIIAAIIVMGTPTIVYYLPVLLITGVVTGIVIGIVGGIVTTNVKKSIRLF